MKTAVAARHGLGAAEAARRLASEGPNELPSPRRHGVSYLLGELLREPMFGLLLAAGSLYVALGDAADAGMLFAAVGLVAMITVYQQRKTERALDALRRLSSPRALVVRDGTPARIPAREVVRGDVLLLEEGDRVPADATVLSAAGLLVDESLLTGESVPVSKIESDGRGKAHAPGGEGQPHVYSGTLIVRGRGSARVDATGPATFMGRIGRRLETLTQETTRLHQEISRLVRVFAAVGIVLCLAAVPLYGLLRGEWLGGVLAGLTLAIAMVPEEFPVVLTIFLALGAWRMSRRKVLARRAQAIEALGSATVLCADKTGTLTVNRMAVAATAGAARAEVLGAAARASRPDGADPMDRALVEAAGELPERTLIQEYPFSSLTRAVGYVWAEGEARHGALKGAPEAVLAFCGLDDGVREQWLAEAARLAARGLRVLGVARAAGLPRQPPPRLEQLRWRFVGLVALADPLRPTARAAVAQCRNAGIRVVMITGDHRATASAVARELGLPRPDDVVLGDELERLDEPGLRWRVRSCDVFARVQPEQKLRLVEALKADGEIVAMTGDGVNDAPALKAAHIGVAMGGRGTDVAREAAALVVLDDDFASIVAAVRMGRRIFDNIRRAMSYLLAVHVPLGALALLPVAFGMPLVLLPIHVVFLEMIIDPACSIVFEADPEEADIMRRPPRPPAERLFDRRVWVLGLLQGLSVAAIVLGVHAFAVGTDWSGERARAATFACMVLANLALIVSNLSSLRTVRETLATRNRALWWTLGLAAGFLGLVVNVPALQKLFRLAPLGLEGTLLCWAVAALTLGWLEALKRATTRWLRPARPAPGT